MPSTRPERDTIAAVLRQARDARGLTQASLALLVGVSKGAVANWETAATAPHADIEPKLLEVLAITARQLRGQEPLTAVETHRHQQRRHWYDDSES